MANICLNCVTHGITEKKDETIKVILPCSNCAQDKGYMWNGKRCFGVSGFSTGRESTAEELAKIWFYMIQDRHEPGEKIDGLTFDEFAKKSLPEECHPFYDDFVKHEASWG
jgi:hypothetical protein